MSIFASPVKALENASGVVTTHSCNTNLSPFVQNADAALFVAQIDSYISAGLPGRLFDILAHKLVSLMAPPREVRST